MNTNKILIAICLSASVLSFSGCKDDLLEEIKTINLDRVLSPTELNARIVNKTNVRLEWKAVTNADSYVVEVFDNPEFSGSPIKAISDIAFSQLPYTITGLAGETEYSVRVKAVGVDIDDSKWVTASITTDAEQIFQPVNLETLAATSAVLNWPAGEAATSIILTPGNISHTVTSAEVAAGQATISGLTGETAYTAKLMNGAKVRGTITFTTTIDLGGAIAVSPEDDLAALLTNAEGGEVFALLPGTYDILTEVTISKSLSIKGAKPTDKPIVNGLVLKVKGNAGLSLKDLVLNGPNSANTNQMIIYDEDSTTPYAALSVQDSEIKNYGKGIMYVNKKALIESVTFSGNTIHSIEGNGGDFIDFRTGLAKSLLFENNTVYNSVLARDLFRMDGGGSTNFPGITSAITIRTNTFNNVSIGASNRFLYIRLASHTINFSKNIIANSGGYYSNQPLTTITTMANNNYFAAPNFTTSTTSNAKNDAGPFTTLDPGFANAATGNFTVTNEDLKLNGIGAPKWR